MDEFWHGTRLGITCAPVRQLLIDYLHEHQLGSDHASIRGLAYTLGALFWRDLEIHEPGISSIKLTPAAAARWKQRIQVKTATAPAGSGGTITVQSRRSTAPNILLQVRAFYLDLAQWAADAPSRWRPWAVPCPIRDEIWYHKEASRRKARMDLQRTRERLPVPPALVAAVDRDANPPPRCWSQPRPCGQASCSPPGPRHSAARSPPNARSSASGASRPPAARAPTWRRRAGSVRSVFAAAFARSCGLISTAGVVS